MAFRSGEVFISLFLLILTCVGLSLGSVVAFNQFNYLILIRDLIFSFLSVRLVVAVIRTISVKIDGFHWFDRNLLMRVNDPLLI